ncbi:hypothetical protein CIT292_10665 [Citrobacter youngae ATCC 29220]|uniref:Uncharacterized protein n=1 Tax=Citrobacter youngae ATCC 29220 TaxID=500640 RepID=D4BK49_9ENTR|nr:hypothetical protein CIT292_10665 [Citrobacter youngae ATCC 29220]
MVANSSGFILTQDRKQGEMMVIQTGRLMNTIFNSDIKLA